MQSKSRVSLYGSFRYHFLGDAIRLTRVLSQPATSHMSYIPSMPFDFPFNHAHRDNLVVGSALARPVWVSWVVGELWVLQCLVLELVDAPEDDQTSGKEGSERLPDGGWVCAESKHDDLYVRKRVMLCCDGREDGEVDDENEWPIAGKRDVAASEADGGKQRSTGKEAMHSEPRDCCHDSTRVPSFEGGV